jgi:hypothetical protein
MFGTDFFSRYYGAAGFNRHLLHHWDPEISYTLFDEMEAFIARTPLADKVEEARTIYPDTFKAMLATARNG